MGLPFCEDLSDWPVWGFIMLMSHYKHGRDISGTLNWPDTGLF